MGRRPQGPLYPGARPAGGADPSGAATQPSVPREQLEILLTRARADRRQIKRQLDQIDGYLRELPPRLPRSSLGKAYQD